MRWILRAGWVVMLATSVAGDELPSERELTIRLAEDPEDQWALYNLALHRYLGEDFGEAARLWRELSVLEPEDWQVREKLIQALSGGDRRKAVEREIRELRGERESGVHPDLSGKPFFIRDQFEVGEKRVFTIEYFELEGDRPLLWKFLFKVDDEHGDHWVSVGSYPATTEGMRNRGEIEPDQRAFHLDGYGEDGSHRTYAFYTGVPDYWKVREEVRAILAGTREPISSTTPIGVNDLKPQADPE